MNRCFSLQLLCLFSFFLLEGSLLAQSFSSTEQAFSAKEWLIDGKACYDDNHIGEAYRAIEQSLRMAREQKDRSLESEALLWMGECAFMENKNELCITYCLQAKEIVDKDLNPADNHHYFQTLQTLGVCSAYLGNLEEQQSYYRQALAFCQQYFPNDNSLRAEAYSMVSSTYFRTLKLDSAIFWVDSALLFSRNQGLWPRVATSLLNQGVIYSILNDFDRAIQVQQEALSITKDLNEISRGQTNLADYYLAIGQADEALNWMHKARQSIQENNQLAPEHYWQTELRAAAIYQQLGDSLKFEQTLDNILTLIPKERTFLHLYKTALHYAAQAELTSKNYLKAEQLCRQALDASGGQFSSLRQATSFRLMAEAFSGQGRHREAVDMAQAALASSILDFDSTDFSDNPSIDLLQAPENDLIFLSLKMRLLIKAHEQAPQQNYLRAALATFYLTDSLMMDNRKLLRSQASRLALAQEYRPFNQAAVKLFHELYQVNKERKWLNEAFRCMERGRSLLISESLAQAYAIERAVPDSLRLQESQYSIRSNYLRLKLRKNPPSEENSKERQKWNQELSQNEKAWDQLILDLEETYSEYYQLKYTFPFPYPAQIQNELLNEQEALLSYVACDSVVYCVGIRPDSVCFERLVLSNSLDNQVSVLQKKLADKSDAYYPIAGNLYQEILAPLDGFWQGHNLLIIPDGKLWMVPFGALPTQEKTVNVRPQLQNFLIKETNIRWLYAAHGAILHKRNEQQNLVALKTYGWVGLAPYHDVSFTQNDQYFPALPDSKKELEAIYTQVSAYPHKMFLGQSASKANLFDYANQAEIIHLATHTLLDEEEASLSGLFFYPNEFLPIEEHRLLVQELFSRRWLAGLTILSACQTNSGKIEGGEGVAGIARAFSLAGSPNVVASLWNINDAGSSRLMEGFYENLLLKKGKNEAFSEAQRQYLSSADALALHPYFWASFVHIGDNTPIQLPPPSVYWSQWLWVFLGGGLISVLIILMLYRKSRA